MSQWTHINAVIRFDCARVLGMKLPDLGTTCAYDESDDSISEATVPCGSEGSMRYKIWENPNVSEIGGYTVMFWGDLRDYDSRDEIFDYFKKITKSVPIRSGLLEIEIEFNRTYTYRFHAHDRKWVLINDISNK